MLHVTNGSSVSLAETGLGGEILVWRDTLDGVGEVAPLAEELGRHDEIVLWFEHDLYDQAQLIELLSCLRGRAGISLVGSGRYLGPMTASELRGLWPSRHLVRDAEFELGAAAWAAFSSGNPKAVQDVLAGDTSALPYLAGGLRRWLEQLPSARNGLSRTQRQILEIAAEGGHTFATLFGADQRKEERIFMGDTQFQEWIRGLMECPVPLLEADADTYRITAAGREVLAGHADHVALNGLAAPYRWDATTGSVQAG
jgi:hypothetical protein